MAQKNIGGYVTNIAAQEIIQPGRGITVEGDVVSFNLPIPLVSYHSAKDLDVNSHLYNPTSKTIPKLSAIQYEDGTQLTVMLMPTATTSLAEPSPLVSFVTTARSDSPPKITLNWMADAPSPVNRALTLYATNSATYANNSAGKPDYASPLDEYNWAPNKRINALEFDASQNELFLGGDFDKLGNYTINPVLPSPIFEAENRYQERFGVIKLTEGINVGSQGRMGSLGDENNLNTNTFGGRSGFRFNGKIYDIKRFSAGGNTYTCFGGDFTSFAQTKPVYTVPETPYYSNYGVRFSRADKSGFKIAGAAALNTAVLSAGAYGNLTIECWIKFYSLPATDIKRHDKSQILFETSGPNWNNGTGIHVGATEIYIRDEATWWPNTALGPQLSGAPVLHGFEVGTWHHLAIVRQTNAPPDDSHFDQTSIFVDGVFKGTIRTLITKTAGAITSYTHLGWGDSGSTTCIGFNAWGSPAHFDGEMTNLRVVRGQALYDAGINYDRIENHYEDVLGDIGTKFFDVDSEPFNETDVGATAVVSGAVPSATITGTVTLLTFQRPSFIDVQTANPRVLIPVGKPSVIKCSTEDTGPYGNMGDPVSYSVVFNRRNYLYTYGYSTDPKGVGNPFAFGTGNFTVECWVKFDDLVGHQNIFDLRGMAITGAGTFFIYKNANNYIYLQSNGTNLIRSERPCVIGEWYHVVVERTDINAGGIRLYVNGKCMIDSRGNGVATAAVSKMNFTAQNTSPRVGGGPPASVNSFKGLMCGLRVVKGAAVYKPHLISAFKTFLPPTGPVGNAEDGTTLLRGLHDVAAETTVSSGGYQFKKAIVWDPVDSNIQKDEWIPCNSLLIVKDIPNSENLELLDYEYEWYRFDFNSHVETIDVDPAGNLYVGGRFGVFPVKYETKYLADTTYIANVRKGVTQRQGARGLTKIIFDKDGENFVVDEVFTNNLVTGKGTQKGGIKSTDSTIFRVKYKDDLLFVCGNHTAHDGTVGFTVHTTQENTLGEEDRGLLVWCELNRNFNYPWRRLTFNNNCFDIHFDGGTVYIGGNFSTVTEHDETDPTKVITKHTRKGLVAISYPNGISEPGYPIVVKNWDPSLVTNGAVDNTTPLVANIETDENAVYVLGAFKSVNNIPRSRLAAISKVGSISETDTVYDWFADLNGSNTDRFSKLLSIPSTHPLSGIVVGSAFTTVNGVSRNNVAKLVNHGHYLVPLSYKYVDWEINGSVLGNGMPIVGADPANWAHYKTAAGMNNMVVKSELPLSLSTINAFSGIQKGDPIKLMIKRTNPAAGNYDKVVRLIGIELDFDTSEEIADYVDHTNIQIASQPVGAAVYVNYPVTFSVQTVPNPLTLSYQWYKGSVPIEGANSSSYTILSASTSDASEEYYVLVSNDLNSLESNTVGLSVTNLDMVSSLPDDITSLYSKNVTLSVAVDHTQRGFETLPTQKAPNFAWYFNGTLSTSAAGLSVITINDVQPWKDTGEYKVVVFNDYGSIESTTNLDVVSISITQQPVSASVLLEQLTSFAVQASSNTMVEYYWMHNSVIINPAIETTKTVVNTAQVNGVGSSTLNLLTAFRADAGTYSVMVSTISSVVYSDSVELEVIAPDDII